jgi:PAS domain S-box-containing protein
MPGPNSLQDSRKLAAILAFANEAVISLSLDGTIAEWNPAATRMFGYSAGEIIDKPFVSIVPEEYRSQELELLKAAGRGDRTLDFSTRRIQKNGTNIEVSTSYCPIRDEGNSIVAVLNISLDITDRSRLELVERDRLFLSSIVSSAEDAIVSKDLNGNVTSWNTGAERLFGYTASEMIGNPISRLVPPEHPNEEPQILERIRRGERIEHYETRRMRKGGETIEVSVTISPVRDRLGRIVGASKIARDVTDQRRWRKAEVAESFLGALVGSAEDAIISKNLEGHVTNWNAAAERLFGYSAEEMLGKPLTILLPDNRQDEESQILRRIRRGERIDHYETKRRRKDGYVLEVAQTISPIRDNLGRIIGISNITRDISVQKRSEERERQALLQAQEARRQAEEANRAKDEFLATISHELRTPMTAILGWSRILASGTLDPDRQRQALETIDRNAQAQAQLIEDLLDISRIVSGRLRIETKVVDMAAVVAAAVEAVHLAAEAKHIRLQAIVSSGAGPIRGDAQRLQQVVWNLLTNAIKFTPRNGNVQIELERVESQIQLRVVDNGIGIKPDFVQHLFERFSQADSSITRSGGGLGMGLAIVKSLVELHGGVITANSAGEGKGATFTVKLPISAFRQEEPLPVAERESSVAIAKYEGLVGLKILVVDDEQDTCSLLRFLLEDAGAIVETALGAEPALLLFGQFQPEILISDVGMPKVNGYELIRILREERHSDIPAVALTAMARIEDRIKALSAGFQMHVAKPIEPKELMTIIASLVGLVNRRHPETDRG